MVISLVRVLILFRLLGNAYPYETFFVLLFTMILDPSRWKSTTSLASPGVPAENELRARSQSTYSLSGTGTVANTNTR